MRETKRHLPLTLYLYSSMHCWGAVEAIEKNRILNPHNQLSPTKLVSGVPVSCSVYEVQQSCAITQISLYSVRFAGWCASAACTLSGKIPKASSPANPLLPPSHSVQSIQPLSPRLCGKTRLPADNLLQPSQGGPPLCSPGERCNKLPAGRLCSSESL